MGGGLAALLAAVDPHEEVAPLAAYQGRALLAHQSATFCIASPTPHTAHTAHPSVAAYAGLCFGEREGLVVRLLHHGRAEGARGQEEPVRPALRCLTGFCRRAAERRGGRWVGAALEVDQAGEAKVGELPVVVVGLEADVVVGEDKGRGPHEAPQQLAPQAAVLSQLPPHLVHPLLAAQGMRNK